MTAAALRQPATREWSRLAAPLALTLLAVLEVVAITIAFDTQSLERSHSVWVEVINYSPQYLQLAISIAVVTAFLCARQFIADAGDALGRASLSGRASALALHLGLTAVFATLTGVIVRGDFDAMTSPAAWTVAWLLTAALSVASWARAVMPWRVWAAAAGRSRRDIALGAGLGTATWAGGLAAASAWRPLSLYTFRGVEWMLGLFYEHTVTNPARLLVGTPRFSVIIAPECSGYAGIGLVLVFLSGYLWLFRNEMRFPRALALLPLGAAAVWILNVVRIVALIALGTAGWKAVALGGFHSQAGWLAFNAVSLGFVALVHASGWFVRQKAAVGDAGRDPTAAYLMPFATILAATMLTGAFSAGFDWLYPVRVAAVGTVLLLFRRSYSDLTWTWSWPAIGIGAVTFVIWIVLAPAVSASQAAPAVLSSAPSHWAAVWLVARILGYVVAVPLAEELAFRGYVSRRVIRDDFQNVPIGFFTWPSFIVSSVVFGAMHGQFWLGGTIAGMLFALALYKRRAFGDAVQAHATVNALIVMYVLVTNNWSVWS